MAEQELAHYREAYPGLPARVELRDDLPGVMVSKGHLLVARSMSLSDERSEAILHHEVGTHVLTYYNGLHQPLSQFHAGMPGYEETQEGIAVLAEHLCGGLTHDRLRLLAGRVVAVDSVVNGANFLETFLKLSDQKVSAQTPAPNKVAHTWVTLNQPWRNGLSRACFVPSLSLDHLLTTCFEHDDSFSGELQHCAFCGHLWLCWSDCHCSS